MIDYKEVGLTEDDVKKMYRSMQMGRRLDERMWLLNRAGKLPFVISCQGQEATQVGMAYALKKGDISAPYYRDLAFVTHMGITAEETMLSAFAKEGDTSSGAKQMPAHFSKRSHGILTQGSCVGTQILHAVGAALSMKMDDSPNVALATIGEGTSNQGDFHEGLNFAGVHKLPFICVIENNEYAISVPKSLQYAADKLSDRAVGYGIHGEHVDGNDPFAVYRAVSEARTRAVQGEGATLIEAMCTRLTAHSSDDDDSYRSVDEKTSNKDKDCIILMRNYMIEHLIADENWFESLDMEIAEIINHATKSAEQAPYPAAEEAMNHVYGGQRNG